MPDPIYLDHAATTPLRPEARAAMKEGFRIWANPSSPHAAGRKARAALEEARERIKAALDWDGEVIFTSGASEAAALALGQSRFDYRLVSAVEHESVLRAAPDIATMAVNSNGAIDRFEITCQPQLDFDQIFAVQHVNSETGNLQDIAGVRDANIDAGGTLLVDCSQSAGKLPIPDCDMAIVSAHKFGGPVGVGALLVREISMLEPRGGQERGYRRGTENLPGVLGMAEALEACEDPYLQGGVDQALQAFAEQVRAAGGVWFADRLDRPTPFVNSVAMPGLSGKAQLMRFDMAGIAVSQGSACSSGSLRRSHVLEAMGVGADLADRTIRVSPGWTTTMAEIERFAEVWLAMANS